MCVVGGPVRGVSWPLDCHVLRYKGCSPGAIHRNPNFCERFNDPVSPIFVFYDAFNDLQSPNPKKLQKVTFELQKVTNELRKVTKRYKKLPACYEIVTTNYENYKRLTK